MVARGTLLERMMTRVGAIMRPGATIVAPISVAAPEVLAVVAETMALAAKLAVVVTPGMAVGPVFALITAQLARIPTVLGTVTLQFPPVLAQLTLIMTQFTLCIPHRHTITRLPRIAQAIPAVPYLCLATRNFAYPLPDLPAVTAEFRAVLLDFTAILSQFTASVAELGGDQRARRKQHGRAHCQCIGFHNGTFPRHIENVAAALPADEDQSRWGAKAVL